MFVKLYSLWANKLKLVTLKKRKEFILSSKYGNKIFSKHFILQDYCNADISAQSFRFGFTATKKIGNAVKRNRAKRRMRALISGLLKEDKILFQEKHCYVLIAKKSILKTPFFEMYDQLKECLSISWLKDFQHFVHLL